MNDKTENLKNDKKNIFSNIQFFNKIKSIKHIEIYIAILFFCVLALIYFSTLKTDENKTESTNSFTVEYYSNLIESKLENVLSNIKGAGNVSCMVMVESGIEYVYATENEEVSNSNSVSSGTSSKTTSTDTILTITKNGTTTPVVVKENMPKVTGVIVVASGAGDLSVKLELLKAVEALLNIQSKNVEILVGS